MPLNAKRKDKDDTSHLLPQGVYRVVIEKVTELDGPSGFPYFNLRCSAITNGEKWPEAIWEKVSLSPKARFRVDDWLDALEIENVDQDLPPEYFQGKSFWAKVGTKEYNGKWSNEITQYLTPEAAEALLEKEALEEGSSDAVLISTERKTRPAPVATSNGKAKASTKVGELSREDSPF